METKIKQNFDAVKKDGGINVVLKLTFNKLKKKGISVNKAMLLCYFESPHKIKIDKDYELIIKTMLNSMKYYFHMKVIYYQRCKEDCYKSIEQFNINQNYFKNLIKKI